MSNRWPSGWPGNVDHLAKTGDFFEPTTIVVPHRAVGQWLRLWLARQHGIAMNLRLLSWKPRFGKCCVRSIRGRRTRLPNCSTATVIGCWCSMCWHRSRLRTGSGILAAALHSGPANPRLHGRRLWRLADQLASLIRDYEYHRQDALIQHWLRGELGPR